MRYFYDCEFLEDGRAVDLISIGIVASDGREYYAVSDEIASGDLNTRISQHSWLMENVIPQLPLVGSRRRWDGNKLVPVSFELDTSDPSVKSRGEIARDIEAFLLASGEPELWAYYGAYDHVALAQLWGVMMGLPSGIPMFTNDLKTLCILRCTTSLPQAPAGEHNALVDARWNRALYESLMG